MASRHLSATPAHPARWAWCGGIQIHCATPASRTGFSNAAVDEIFNTFLIPQMFAEVAQGKEKPADAARAAERQMKTIFAKWRKRKKI